MIPLNPPNTNITMNPVVHASTGSQFCTSTLPIRVIIQVKTFIPVGTPITMVAAEK